MEIGSIIKKVREAKGLSQRDVISNIGMGAAMYSRIERGKTEPSLTTLERIVKALGISMSELFESDDKSIEDINSVDKSVLEKVQIIESLGEDERRIVFSVVDAFVGKSKLKDVLTNVLKEVK